MHFDKEHLKNMQSLCIWKLYCSPGKLYCVCKAQLSDFGTALVSGTAPAKENDATVTLPIFSDCCLKPIGFLPLRLPWRRWRNNLKRIDHERSDLTLTSTGRMAVCQSLATTTALVPGLNGKTSKAFRAALLNSRKRCWLSCSVAKMPLILANRVEWDYEYISV